MFVQNTNLPSEIYMSTTFSFRGESLTLAMRYKLIEQRNAGKTSDLLAL